MSARACSLTALALTPTALVSRMPAALQFGERKLVVADPNGLNPLQFLGTVEQVIPPGAGNHQHIEVGHARCDGVGAVLPGKPLLQGGVR